jgi:hypothetical protein
VSDDDDDPSSLLDDPLEELPLELSRFCLAAACASRLPGTLGATPRLQALRFGAMAARPKRKKERLNVSMASQWAAAG